MSWEVGDRIEITRPCALVCHHREKPAGSAFFADAFQRLTLDAGTVLEVYNAGTRRDKTQAVMPLFWVVGMNRPLSEPVGLVSGWVDDPNALWPDGSAKPNYQRRPGRLQIETTSGFSVILDPRFFQKASP